MEATVGFGTMRVASTPAARASSRAASAAVLAVVVLLAAAVPGPATASEKRPLLLGGLFPHEGGWDVGKYCQPAAEWAVRHVNDDPEILPAYTLELDSRNSKCDSGPGLQAFFDFISREDPPIVGIVGGGCSVVCQPTAGVSHFYELVQVGWGCTSPALGERDKYPYFLSAINSEVENAIGQVQLINTFGYTRIATIAENEELFTSTINGLLRRMEEADLSHIDVLHSTTVSRSASRLPLQQVKDSGARVIVVTAYADMTRELLCSAYRLDMIDGYVFVLPGWFTGMSWKPSLHVESDEAEGFQVDCTDEEMDEAAQSFGVTADYNVPEEDEQVTIAKRTPSNITTLFRDVIPGVEQDSANNAGLAYDTVWLWALALHAFLEHPHHRYEDLGYNNATTRAFLHDQLKNAQFYGATGPFVLGSRGIRDAPLSVYNRVRGLENSYHRKLGVLSNGVLAQTAPIVWAGGAEGLANKPPDAVAEADADEGGVATGVIVAVAVAAVLVVVCFVGVGVTRMHRRQLATIREKHQHLVQYDELEFNERIGAGMQGEVFLGKLHGTTVAIKRFAMDEPSQQQQQQQASDSGEGPNAGADALKRSVMQSVMAGRSFASTGDSAESSRRRGRKGSSPGSTSLSQEAAATMQEEIALLCTLRHPNVLLFIACTAPPVVCLVTEYCGRRSLEDVLYKPDEQPPSNINIANGLPLTLRMSLVTDFARGMSYLHFHSDRPMLHCDLKPANLFILDSWQLKVGDLGLSQVFGASKLQAGLAVGSIMWMSPEVMHGWTYTRSCDVFSFGIIANELFAGELPYSARIQQICRQPNAEVVLCREVAPLQMYARVDFESETRSRWSKHSGSGGAHERDAELQEALDVPGVTPLRPLLGRAPREYQELVQLCWHWQPTTRPNFKEILEHLERLSGKLEEETNNFFRDTQPMLLDLKRSSAVLVPPAFTPPQNLTGAHSGTSGAAAAAAASAVAAADAHTAVRVDFDEKSRSYIIALPRKEKLGVDFVQSPTGSFLMEEAADEDEEATGWTTVRQLEVYASSIVSAGVCSGAALAKSVVLNIELDAALLGSMRGHGLDDHDDPATRGSCMYTLVLKLATHDNATSFAAFASSASARR